VRVLKYFKNTELAKLYNVSEKSVRNWIQAAIEGKLDIQLYDVNGKQAVANTARNTFVIEGLVAKGKKYKNSRSFKTFSPQAKFYDTYNHKQILNIISNLTIHHEIPLQYSYQDGGADFWDQFANRLAEEETPNILTKTIELLDTVETDLERFIEGDRKVNIIDLGPGNGLPVRALIDKLQKKERLGRYVGIDTSKEMLGILEKNIRTWYKGAVTFEGHVRDISYERFNDVLDNDFIEDENKRPINLILLLGGTLSNFRSPTQALEAISSSMSLTDLLIYTEKLDAPATRRYFDFNITPQSQKLAPRHKIILDLMNIDPSTYDIEQFFDEKKEARFIRIRPTIDIAIDFSLESGPRRIELRKNEPIVLWRAWHWNLFDVIDQFNESDFEALQVSRSRSTEFALVLLRLNPSA
jgi:uncharacterized SAM-dependent methyltransferase